VHAALWQHDGSRKGPKDAQVFGNNWLIAGVVVDLPFIQRPVCLPVPFALATMDGPSKQVLAGRLVTASRARSRIAGWVALRGFASVDLSKPIAICRCACVAGRMTFSVGATHWGNGGCRCLPGSV
jgi:hypothetical protein